MGTFDVEKRARELCFSVFKDHEVSIWSNTDRPSWTQQAIQLAREAVNAEAEKWAEKCAEFQREGDRAADARAEEIAQAIERRKSWCLMPTEIEGDAAIARSTIANPTKESLGKQAMDGIEEQLWAPEPSAADKYDAHLTRTFNGLAVAPDGTLSGTLPCGHSVNGIVWRDTPEGFGSSCVCAYCRDRKPETREQRLEAALLWILREPRCAPAHSRAATALEEK